MNFNLFDDIDDRVIYNKLQGSVRTNSSSELSESRTSSDAFPPKTPLAMAYVPMQQWGNIYDDNAALENGTLFPDLHFPFLRGADSNE